MTGDASGAASRNGTKALVLAMATVGRLPGVDVPAGLDAVATATVSAADRTVVVTVSLVAAPTTTTVPAPVTARFTG